MQFHTISRQSKNGLWVTMCLLEEDECTSKSDFQSEKLFQCKLFFSTLQSCWNNTLYLSLILSTGKCHRLNYLNYRSFVFHYLTLSFFPFVFLFWGQIPMAISIHFFCGNCFFSNFKYHP